MSASIDIRNETAADIAEVRDVNNLAFGGTFESRLVDALRAANKATISLVAVQDRRVVGHILFSPITIAHAPKDFRGLGLAPMSVLPEFQNKGIGSMLVHEGLKACRHQSVDAVVVLGHTPYYPRFGFRKASDHGLDNEYGATDAFMVLELKPGALSSIRGLIKYAPEFKTIV